MKIDMIPSTAQTLASFLEKELSDPHHSTFVCAALRDALADILDALDDEAERQHLDRSYPEGGY